MSEFQLYNYRYGEHSVAISQGAATGLFLVQGTQPILSPTFIKNPLRASLTGNIVFPSTCMR